MLNYMLKEIKVINCGRGSGECKKNKVCKINDKKLKIAFLQRIYMNVFLNCIQHNLDQKHKIMAEFFKEHNPTF